MHEIAIIASGQSGLLAAHGLLRAVCKVTLYSDRSANGRTADWRAFRGFLGAGSR